MESEPSFEPKSRFFGAFGKIHADSAANASLWLCILCLPCFWFAYLTTDLLFRAALTIIGAAIVVNAVVTIQRFAWGDPWNLRPPDVHLRKILAEQFGDDDEHVSIITALLATSSHTTRPPRVIEHKPND